MNRQQRRALERGKAKRPMVRIGELTLDEAEILEEALDLYLREQWAHVEGEPDMQQRWVIGRAEQMQRLLYAAVHRGAAYDTHGERTLSDG